MYRRIVRYLTIIFFLFSVGGTIAIYSLSKVTSDLKTLINLHRVEIIRQDLLVNIKTVQNNLLAIGTTFGPELDVIVRNVMSLDRAAKGCSGCHHRPEISRRLKNIEQSVEKYKDALSALITTTANPERLERLKMVAVDIGEYIIEDVGDMTFIANKILQGKTEKALEQVRVITFILVSSLFLTLIVGFIIAIRLTRDIVTPVQRLTKAAKELAGGKMGLKVELNDPTEIGELARTFNEMSQSLKRWHDSTVKYMNRLKGLHRFTLSLHLVNSREEIIREYLKGVSEFISAGEIILTLTDQGGDQCWQYNSETGLFSCPVQCDTEVMQRLYESEDRRYSRFLKGEEPLRQLFPARDDIEDVYLVWVRERDRVIGALMLINTTDRISDDDIRLVMIISSNFAVALENAALYDSLKEQMRRLQETQEQLVQAAKLAAIGELSANIAHEINNPLTTILGYAELLKEETDIESIMRDIDIIESESIRARDIVRQLLEFSRKRPLNLTRVDINETIEDVLRFVAPNIKGLKIRIEKDYKDIPPVKADINQLKQVLLNVINNAVQAMPEGGVIGIRTYQRDGHVCVEVKDTGVGIPDEVLPRIFEPFFTTKKEKGTGLGLPISYRIVEEHGGRMEVRSKEGEGTMIRILLPLKGPSLQIFPSQYQDQGLQ